LEPRSFFLAEGSWKPRQLSTTWPAFVRRAPGSKGSCPMQNSLRTVLLWSEHTFPAFGKRTCQVGGPCDAALCPESPVGGRIQEAAGQKTAAIKAIHAAAPRPELVDTLGDESVAFACCSA
jgi:hypothetical protein